MPRKFNETSIGTLDQVGANTCDLKKLFLLCIPVNENGDPIDDPSLNHCCYKAICPETSAVSFNTQDQFGPLAAQTRKPLFFCTPCGIAQFP